MGKGILNKILEKNQAADLYDYWLSVHGKVATRRKPVLSDWGLDIIFTLTNRGTGKIKGQQLDFFYHGTARKFKSNIENRGLKTTEGLVCLTRRVTYALELFSLMGNYTMVGNKTVDKEIKKLGKKPKAAFEYWCQDAIREELGLLTVWRPPVEMVALGKYEKDLAKRHFALYRPETGETAADRRKELADEKGKKIYLSPKYLLAELKPILKLRLALAKLEQDFAHGGDILNRKEELNNVIPKAILKLTGGYSRRQLIDDFLISVMEGYTLSLVYVIVLSIIEGRIPQKRLIKLANLKIPIDYLNAYRNKVLKKSDKIRV